ncbi:hypothetical protein MMC20_002616 [Loxospora ochrophaea]|nr:hypothetical protein [Loxospora ochrophaea]
MGVKGIYQEIGPGERVALSKLAVEKIENTRRPLRIAIDISIWDFQIQCGKGGSNPALRTLYYRLIRLLYFSIQPVFVFDGPNKPSLKRNVSTKPQSVSLQYFHANTQRMLGLFGFAFHTAPGEAEAECALLQRKGIVDAVLSEDVDTLMFGCTLSMRNWGQEGTKGNKAATHVDIYNAEAIKNGQARLDKEGMILIALMSGGDYNTAGVPGCGIQIACQAARAGFGRDLCRLLDKDYNGLRQWRERLQDELCTNKSGCFRVKHKALKIPDSFPDETIFGYYKNPVVSSAETVRFLRTQIKWDRPVDVQGLRNFVGEAFNWRTISGARRLIRGLAPALLVHQLRVRSESGLSDDGDNLEAQASQEAHYIAEICGPRRTHFLTDGMPELRVAYIPNTIVPINLSEEEPDEPIYNSEGLDKFSENIEESDGGKRSRSKSPTKEKALSKYDPTQEERIWILETYVKLGVPLLAETWEEDMRDPRKFATRKCKKKVSGNKTGMKKGALDAFVKVRKPVTGFVNSSREACLVTKTFPQIPMPATQSDIMKPPCVKKVDERNGESRLVKTPTKSKSQDRSTSKSSPSSRKQNVAPRSQSTVNCNINPWTLARRPPDTFDAKLDRNKRYSALGIYPDSSDEALTYKSPSPTPNKQGSSILFHSDDAVFEKNSDFSLQTSHEDNRLRTLSRTKDTTQPSLHAKPTSIQSSSTQIPNPDPIAPLPNRLPSEPSIPSSPPDLPSTPQRVNRRLNFDLSPCQPHASPASVSSSLPSPSSILPQLRSPRAASKPTTISKSSVCGTEPMSLTGKSRARRLVALRESLEGAWREVDEGEVKVRARRAGREMKMFRDIEVVDLTEV